MEKEKDNWGGERELKADTGRYHMGDLIGRRGLEQMYEDLLHGSDGQIIVTQYARGRPQFRTDAYGRAYVDVDEFGHKLQLERARLDPIPGGAVRITLDIGLQALTEALLEGEEGAIVVLNADSGEVLALTTAPAYDPSVFVDRGISKKRRNALVQELLHSKPNRMINRAFQEVYAPGSVFKLLVAAAALEEGVIDANTTHYCPGYFRINANTRSFACWKRSGHGEMRLVDALAFSCDVFFYNVGLELGVDRIKLWSSRFGLGEKVGLDLPGEVAGLIPSRKWKERQFRPKHPNDPWEYRWYPGETANLSIGQGYTAVTPLQIAVLVAAITNGGHRVRPYLNRLKGPQLSEPLLSQATLDLLLAGMRKCVEKGPPAPTGTGRLAAVKDITVVGKTGSSQIMSLIHHAKYKTEEEIPKNMRDHAWFVAGVPDQDPPIAICILVEHGHHGSSVAAPLAKEIIEYFYQTGPKSSLTLAKQRAAAS